MEDKRKFPRFQVRKPIAYYPEDDVTRFTYTRSNNISRGGVCINAMSNIVHKDDIINMEININGNECASATGKVIWTKRFDLDSHSGSDAEFINNEVAGIEFLKIDPAHLQNLLK